jgi:hypothetical protein
VGWGGGEREREREREGGGESFFGFCLGSEKQRQRPFAGAPIFVRIRCSNPAFFRTFVADAFEHSFLVEPGANPTIFEFTAATPGLW